MAEGGSTIHNLPNEIIEKVLSYLPYENISGLRVISRRFDNVCQQLLNQGFSKADKYHALCQREIKAQLPRRESERRCHPLARHVDILSATETRMSLLGMTYMKYIDMGLCCFIPGKVIDEIFRILNLLRTDCKPPRAHELLQELRDISSMAMEHFDEKIVPNLKRQMTPHKVDGFGDNILEPMQCPSSFNSMHMSLPTPQMRLPSIRQDIAKMQKQVHVCGATLVTVKKHMNDCKNKSTEQTNKVTKLENICTDLKKTVTKQAKRLNTQEKKITEQNKKLLEYDQKFADILAEISSLHGRKLSVADSVMPSTTSDMAKDNSQGGKASKNSGNGGDKVKGKRAKTAASCNKCETESKTRGQKRKVEQSEAAPRSKRKM